MITTCFDKSVTWVIFGLHGLDVDQIDALINVFMKTNQEIKWNHFKFKVP